MKKFVLASLLAMMTTTAFAWVNPDQKTTCYTFKNNKLQNKSTCVMQTGGGAGGMYLTLKVGKKSYHFETETLTEAMKTVYYPIPNNFDKTKDVIDYYRHPKTYKIVEEYQIGKNTNALFCQKTKDGKVDICYK